MPGYSSETAAGLPARRGWRYRMRVTKFGILAAVGMLWSCLAFANTPPPPKLTHGPLLGCGSDVVWVRTSAAATVVLEHGFSADFVGSIMSPSIVTNTASDFTAHFRLANLPPDTLVYYRVWMNSALVTPVKRFRT